MRTDKHNNPTAMTIDIAKQAGLALGTDYEKGDPFTADGVKYYTARLLGDPITLTIRAINSLGFYSTHRAQRWDYIGIPKFLWDGLSPEQKLDVIGFMYGREKGTAMRHLFPNYGKA